MRSEFFLKVMTYQQALELLRQNSDSKLAGFNNKIINSSVPAIGCTLPFVRCLAKNCSVQDAESFPTHEFYETDLLKGIVISSCKLPFCDKAPKLSAFAQTIENWAVCDSSTVKVSSVERERYFRFFCDMLSCSTPFVCRYGMINLIAYLDDDHIGQIFDKLSVVTQWGHYYVDMGAAWLVATAIVKCRDQTIAFMENDGRKVLDKFTYNKALQKMRDSFRVSDEDKEWTRSLKI